MLFDAPLTGEALATLEVPVHVVEGAATSAVDHAICDVVLRHAPRVRHSVLPGAGHMMPLTHARALTPILVAAIGDDARR